MINELKRAFRLQHPPTIAELDVMLERALATARAEGFAAAREMGAAHVERILGKRIGDEIRAMQDERAGKVQG